ncbi:MAG TPA: hypothetical protein VKG25_22480 [Bryobacteraceae bacterium]|nr:hypothetical protein [Bryobacteraceae bacterium]
MNKILHVATTTVLAAGLAISAFAGQAGTAPAPAAKAAAATTKTTTPAPTAQEIADAKSKGMVWANTTSKVYHTDGKHYGTTKHGKFITKEDAEKAGFKAAKEPVAGKTKVAKATATTTAAK